LNVNCPRCHFDYDIQMTEEGGDTFDAQCPTCAYTALVQIRGQGTGGALTAEAIDPLPDPFAEGAPGDLASIIRDPLEMAPPSAGRVVMMNQPEQDPWKVDPQGRWKKDAQQISGDLFKAHELVSPDRPAPVNSDNAEGTADLSQTMEEPRRNCERCGASMLSDDPSILYCGRCRETIKQALGNQEKDPLWRIKRPDGSLEGPFRVSEIKAKYRRGDIGDEDQVARADLNFRPISQFSDFASLFRQPTEGAQTSSFNKVTVSASPRYWIFGVAMLVIALLSGVLVVLLSDGQKSWWEGHPRAVELFGSFSAEIPKPGGSLSEHLLMGRRFMVMDNRLSYQQADKAYKSAMLLSRNNLEAFAGWVQNLALLELGQANPKLRNASLELLDYALLTSPREFFLHRARAFLFLSLGKVLDARKAAERALELSPEDAQSILVLGATYIESSSDKAIELILKAQKSNPELNLTIRLLSDAYLRQGRFRQAYAVLQERLQKDPGEYETLLSSANVLQQVGKYEKARGLFEQILASEPEEIEARIGIARLLTQVHRRPTEALEWLQKAPQNSPKASLALSSDLWTEVSIAQRLLGQFPRSGEAVARALQLNPESSAALYAQAAWEQDSGQDEKARAHLLDLSKNLEKWPRLAIRLVEAELRGPTPEQAPRHLNRALENLPYDVDLHLAMAVTHLQDESLNETYLWLKRAVTIDPFYEEMRQRITPYFEGLRPLRPLLSRALRALERHSNDSLLQALTAMLQLRLGERDQAQAHLLQALKLDADCFVAHLVLGGALYSENRFSDALASLRAAQRLDSIHRTVSRLLGVTLVRLGRLAEARGLFSGILNAAPGDLQIKLELAQIAWAAGEKQSAIDLLLKIYTADNDVLPARRLLFDWDNR